ncbi:alpha-tocopherol transfer protein-like [Argiope bruennichi]|uniref:Alpha-tocopherol transfer protein-like like protein n=1 Tax=Argiope bruennichi TaxID=94029 RepID=A0A8T0EQH8_ARGBR|nr:alpha-tocopherol transfer protein-like [Argiope bruennichi]KAF8778030.1 Alpha-tocopherol transfer protein-like like protein [Argiope bruennichi]
MEMDNSRSEFLRYDTTDTNDPVTVKNMQEINETEETRARCLEILRRDLKRVKDLEPCLDEIFLSPFMRVSKYDTAKAFQRVIKYYQQLDVYLDIYKKFSFPLQEAESIRHLKLSPYRCADNSFLLFGKAAIDYRKYTFAHRFYLELVTSHNFIQNPVNQICGGTFVFDYEGMDIHGYLAFTPSWTRVFVDSLLNTYPCRVKAMHVVNMPSFFPLILKVLNQFLPKKIKNRVFFHAKKNDWKDLHASISPEILPEKFGGKLKEDELVNIMHDLKAEEEKFLSFFAYGNIKTKKDRLSMKVFQ